MSYGSDAGTVFVFAWGGIKPMSHDDEPTAHDHVEGGKRMLTVATSERTTAASRYASWRTARSRSADRSADASPRSPSDDRSRDGPRYGILSRMSRDPIEARVLAQLDELGVVYERIACDPELADTEAFCAHYGYPLDESANAIVVASKKEPRVFAACMALATTRLDVNKAVRDQLGVGRLSFASADDMRRVTGMEVGGVTPFALPDDLLLLIDAAVMAPERVIVGTGGRTSKVLVPPSALLLHRTTRVVEGLARRRS